MNTNKFKMLWLVPVIASTIGLAACSNTKSFELSEYIAAELPYKEDFRILQLTDLHLSNKDDLKKQFAFLDLTINEANADLIVITGDLFTFGTKSVAKSLFNYLESKNTPWTVVFGNHDEQTYFSVEWMTNYLNKLGGNCKFKDNIGDKVFGNCNFAINLVDAGVVKQQIYCLDSNRYDFSKFKSYDYVKESQINWYEEMVTKAKADNAGVTVPSLAFFHIPLQEWEEGYNKAIANDASAKLLDLPRSQKNEGVASSNTNSGFFNKILELNSTKGCFVGHDHINTYAVDYKGVILGYGVKSTNLMYFNDDLMGGQIIKMNSSQEVSFERFFHTYEEVK